jgi:WD40 repeat protein
MRAPAFVFSALLTTVTAASAAAYLPPSKPLWSGAYVSLAGLDLYGRPLTRTQDPKTYRIAPHLDVRDPLTGRVVRSIPIPEARRELYPLGFTPDLKTLAWVNGNVLTVRGPLGSWTVSTPGLSGSRELLFSPDAGTLVIPNEYGYVQFWDVQSRQRRATVLFRGRPDQVKFLPGGKLVAVNGPFPRTSGTTLSLWTLAGRATGTVPGVLRGISRGVFDFSPDGSEVLLKVPGPGYTVGWVNLKTGAVRRWSPHVEVCPLNSYTRLCAYQPQRISLDASGTRALVTDRVGAYLYDATSGKRLATLNPGLSSGSLSPDGKFAYRQGMLNDTQYGLIAWQLP